MKRVSEEEKKNQKKKITRKHFENFLSFHTYLSLANQTERIGLYLDPGALQRAVEFGLKGHELVHFGERAVAECVDNKFGCLYVFVLEKKKKEYAFEKIKVQ